MLPLLFLAIIFLTIIILLAYNKPLYQAVLGGLAVTVILFQIHPLNWWVITSNVFINWSNFSILVSLYLITYLQKMLEEKKQIKLAEQDLNGLFHNRRINTAIAPLFIGLLPSAAAMILCADIVDNTTKDYLDPTEKAFVTSWFRHIPESTLPTYPSVLLMVTLSGVALPNFMFAMFVPIIVLVLLGYVRYLRKIPKDPETPKSQNRYKDVLRLFQHLWSLFLILILILVFKFQVVTATLIVIFLCFFVYRFSFEMAKKFIKEAFELKLLGNMLLVLIFKEFIDHVGVLELLPKILSYLPIPMFLILAILFFVGGIISGAAGIIALGTPIAFAAIPNGGVPLMVLLMCMTHAASQLSPTHVCLLVASEYYHISLMDLLKKTLPFSLLFAFLMIFYYLFLVHIF
ncbi:DUF401 family protein [Amphibacillus sp. Q70]|uniref:DUF401 family protein n=1 Tax=Amphibacillus sp. Q70 TaxID=3453416 RepID=UPI003F83B871